MSAGAAQKHGAAVAAIVGFVVTFVAFIALAVTWISPADRSMYFWRRVAWVEFLFGLAWAYIGGLFTFLLGDKRSASGVGAILPGIGVVAFFYVGSSLLLMAISAFWPSASSWELVSQVYKTAGLIVVLVFLYYSWKAGIAGTERVPLGISAPQSLTALLAQSERALLATFRAAAEDSHADRANAVQPLALGLRELREKIEWSIPHVGRIGRDSRYHEFSRLVENLSNDCMSLAAGPPDAPRTQSCIQRAHGLMGQIQDIAHALRSE